MLHWLSIRHSARANTPSTAAIGGKTWAWRATRRAAGCATAGVGAAFSPTSPRSVVSSERAAQEGAASAPPARAGGARRKSIGCRSRCCIRATSARGRLWLGGLLVRAAGCRAKPAAPPVSPVRLSSAPPVFSRPNRLTEGCAGGSVEDDRLARDPGAFSGWLAVPPQGGPQGGTVRAGCSHPASCLDFQPVAARDRIGRTTLLAKLTCAVQACIGARALREAAKIHSLQVEAVTTAQSAMLPPQCPVSSGWSQTASRASSRSTRRSPR